VSICAKSQLVLFPLTFLDVSIFKHEGIIIINSLLNLGKKIVDNMEDEKIEKIFLDTDFKDRTLMKIITTNEFQQLFASHKLNVLLEQIWQGKNTFDCDGHLSDFSQMIYIFSAPIKKLPGKKIKATELLNNNFRINTKD